jgi:aspartyl-tRNA(Asn)/glutamyl-tRNA(Gln) amidotransferase subunit A
MGEGVDPVVSKAVWEKVKKLESMGAQYHEVSLPITSKYGVYVYYLIAMSEASTNLAKYCGMRYGMHGKLEGDFNEYFSKVRSDNFNAEEKRRIMIGTFARMAGFRDAYYLKATKVRSLIIDEYKKLFSRYDCLVSPTMPIIAPKFSDISNLTPLQNYLMDVMTVGPNLAGIPHLSMTAGHKGELPIGMMLMADHLKEHTILTIGCAL